MRRGVHCSRLGVRASDQEYIVADQLVVERVADVPEPERMRTLEIRPKEGVGPIRFGMTRAEVREHLGQPGGDDAEREWYLKDMAIDFDTSGRVEFIEIAESENFRATFNGRCLLDLQADDAVAHLTAFAPYGEHDPELSYTYVFPDLQVSLWRAVVPDGDQDRDDPTGRRFEAVGVGRDGYFVT